VYFQDCSQNATTYQWDFGDGGTSSERDPIHIYHQSGKFTVIMTSYGDGSSPSNPGDFGADYDTVMLKCDVKRWVK